MDTRELAVFHVPPLRALLLPRETGVSRLSPLSSFLAELWRGEEGGEVVGEGVEILDI